MQCIKCKKEAGHGLDLCYQCFREKDGLTKQYQYDTCVVGQNKIDATDEENPLEPGLIPTLS